VARRDPAPGPAGAPSATSSTTSATVRAATGCTCTSKTLARESCRVMPKCPRSQAGSIRLSADSTGFHLVPAFRGVRAHTTVAAFQVPAGQV
jgi:hypothetical protein